MTMAIGPRPPDSFFRAIERQHDDQDRREHAHGLFYDALRDLDPDETRDLLGRFAREEAGMVAIGLARGLWLNAAAHCNAPHVWQLLDALRAYLDGIEPGTFDYAITGPYGGRGVEQPQ